MKIKTHLEYVEKKNLQNSINVQIVVLLMAMMLDDPIVEYSNLSYTNNIES